MPILESSTGDSEHLSKSYETSRLVVNPLGMDDLDFDAYFRGFHSANSTRFLWSLEQEYELGTVTPDDTMKALLRYREGMIEGSEMTWLLFSKDLKKFLGELQFYDLIEGVLRISLWIIQDEWSRGYASEVIREHLKPWGRKNFGPDILLYWRSHVDNTASIALAQKMGGQLCELIYEDQDPNKLTYVID